MIAGTNQSKNIVTPYGQRKAGTYFWGDIEATWGDTLATWGDVFITPTNQSKSSMGGSSISIGSPMGLLLSITYPATVTTGSMVNQSKS